MAECQDYTCNAHGFCLEVAPTATDDTIKSRKIVAYVPGGSRHADLAIDGSLPLAGVVREAGCKEYANAGDSFDSIFSNGTFGVIGGAAIPNGSPITAGADGCAVVAAAGDYIIGYATTETTQAGEVVLVTLAPGKI